MIARKGAILSSSNADVDSEQAYLTALYQRLDQLREQADGRLKAILLEAGGTPQGRTQREATRSHYAEQLAQMNSVENGLCFGRLDFSADVPRYIGRIGLFAEDRDQDPLLIDWRAAAARPFYLATAVSPEGVTRRRHLRTRGRVLTGVDDEVLDIESGDGTGREDVTGEAALLSALTANRTGRMRDIVETIQAEQDEVIRSGLAGALVVQGGPGTGKTAVALHRAAYLLYTYRQQLTRSGVLILGPNTTFLRYISQVLPSLAETGVLLATLGDMFPGVRARAVEPGAVAALKGDLELMLPALENAVADRQTVPDDFAEVDHDGYPLRIDRTVLEDARSAARRTGRPHNVARAVFVTEAIHQLSQQIADRIGADPLGGDNLLSEADLAETRRELREDVDVQQALFDFWPVLTPRQVLRDLLTDAGRLESAGLPPALLRDESAGWTPADVPLLDELAELLGVDDTLKVREQSRQRKAAIEYAEGVLEIVEGSRSLDFEDVEEEILSAIDVVDASAFVERHEVIDTRTAAERAAADRTWVFGHVIVDEAQELSPMAWRLLMRRCPSRSMTAVGDVAQTSELSGSTTWDQVFEPYVAQRWRLVELSVNYRTPAEVMTVAGDILAAIDPALRPPRSVRSAGVTPWARRVAPEGLAEELIADVRKEAGAVEPGRVGVLVPARLESSLGAELVAAVPGAAVGEQPDLLNHVVLMTVQQAKGLEFDSVLVVCPDEIIAESPRGLSDLYVAVTRATQRLGILHTGPLPGVLSSLG
ncbi:HelD family protein [Actinoplanes awajinensis]|uniref:Helicase n=1 Tax=Actinoplanes awajinensis subsp. mycoplanecinus TaxID=135947 RepID=A0A101JT84_9ACTN|nr:ATP-binding domain-containing protein [Actinoplanes awajinensis]KUL32698.1 helicase [Actinoplanes awajinensis subsp. mycoplanecinus]